MFKISASSKTFKWKDNRRIGVYIYVNPITFHNGKVNGINMLVSRAVKVNVRLIEKASSEEGKGTVLVL